MKSTGLGLLVMVMGVAGVATAQDEELPAGEATPAEEAPAEEAAPEEAPEEAAAEAEEAPAVPPPATTTALPTATAPAAPAPATAVNFTGTAAGADVPEASPALPPRVPWRGTSVEWINSATTSMLGIGDDYQSDTHQSYAMLWRITANYYIVDQDDWSVTVRTQPTFFVELTDADDTNLRNEPQFLDLPLLATYRRNLFSSGLWSTAFSLAQGLILPISPASQNNGTYVIPTHRLVLTQGIPLLGEDAVALKSFTLNGRFRWDHRFSKATTAVDEDLDQLRSTKSITGGSQADDQLSGGAFSHDTLIEGVDVEFSEPVGPVVLSLSSGFVFAQQFKYGFSDQGCEIVTPTSTSPDGCVDVPSSDTAEDTFYTYGFSVGVGIQPLPELALNIDYSSSNSPLGQSQLRPDGRRRSVFYTPEAEFSATLTIYPDAFYERMTGPPRALARDKRKNQKKASF